MFVLFDHSFHSSTSFSHCFSHLSLKSVKQKRKQASSVAILPRRSRLLRVPNVYAFDVPNVCAFDVSKRATTSWIVDPRELFHDPLIQESILPSSRISDAWMHGDFSTVTRSLQQVRQERRGSHGVSHREHPSFRETDEIGRFARDFKTPRCNRLA